MFEETFSNNAAASSIVTRWHTITAVDSRGRADIVRRVPIGQPRFALKARRSRTAGLVMTFKLLQVVEGH
jgi:hypothetical protein